jgi:peptidoglycan hydrolase-like protein with peptidoglycan-binding domain
MTVDFPQRPTELGNVKSPPRRPPGDGSNEFASFAAQLAARQKRFAQASAAPPPSVDYEEVTSHPLSSLLASHRAASAGAGVLLFVTVSVAALVVWSDPFQASTPLPSNRIEQAKADVPAAGQREVTVLASVPAPPAAGPPPGAPPASPRTAASPPPGAREPVKATPELSASQMPSTLEPSSAPLTPDEIRELQGKLKAAGFDPGAADGVVGRQTRSAMRGYAQARSLPNADATRDLLVRLNSEPPTQRPAQEPAIPSSPLQSVAGNSDPAASAAERPEPRKTTCTVDVGAWPSDRTDQAKAIQILLRDLGLYGGTTYGSVGPATRAAIGKFQLAAGEAETGEPSEMVFVALKKKCASAAP